MADKSVQVFAPATVANVASGFDVLGFALRCPGDTLILTRKETKQVDIVSIEGDNGRLPKQTDKNTAAVAAKSFLEAIGFPFGLDIQMDYPPTVDVGQGRSKLVGNIHSPANV